ncbi:hypothetical protein CEUSTIGMA_g3985.t1 [Chlamydomonas eustigma]|uniref:Uncharacterized protein n=1 Tax=Chlamydomonas eustigma TaxID=1157962 RepID=A0A250X0T5_9CHLO|nr:hypothetical protein CEUSTIGMA_g3985.t1 [Chlamydomonas eustigma]|eukprot:GAX76539.1 hypothetical protein CEUSTIGMA_g3985.t1 [Chlamydomonas eustigma]
MHPIESVLHLNFQDPGIVCNGVSELSIVWPEEVLMKECILKAMLVLCPSVKNLTLSNSAVSASSSIPPLTSSLAQQPQLPSNQTTTSERKIQKTLNKRQVNSIMDSKNQLLEREMCLQPLPQSLVSLQIHNIRHFRSLKRLVCLKQHITTLQVHLPWRCVRMCSQYCTCPCTDNLLMSVMRTLSKSLTSISSLQLTVMTGNSLLEPLKGLSMLSALTHLSFREPGLANCQAVDNRYPLDCHDVLPVVIGCKQVVRLEIEDVSLQGGALELVVQELKQLKVLKVFQAIPQACMDSLGSVTELTLGNPHQCVMMLKDWVKLPIQPALSIKIPSNKLRWCIPLGSERGAASRSGSRLQDAYTDDCDLLRTVESYCPDSSQPGMSQSVAMQSREVHLPVLLSRTEGTILRPRRMATLKQYLEESVPSLLPPAAPPAGSKAGQVFCSGRICLEIFVLEDEAGSCFSLHFQVNAQCDLGCISRMVLSCFSSC